MRGPCGGDREAQAKIHGALIAGVEGRRALVAGGASGIGAASAARLAELGAEVVIADIDAANGERVSREIGAQFLAVDLIEYDAPARALALNLEAALNVIHVVLPAMQKGGYGRAVHVASEAGRLGSKGGVIAFTRLIAREKGVSESPPMSWRPGRWIRRCCAAPPSRAARSCWRR